MWGGVRGTTRRVDWRLVETRAGSIVCSIEMFQLPKPVARLQVVVVGCRRIDGEAEVRVTFFSTVAISSLQNLTNGSSLRDGFASSSQRYVLFIVRAPSTPAARRLNTDLRCVTGGLPPFLQSGARDNARHQLCCRSLSAPKVSLLHDGAILHARCGILCAAFADSLVPSPHFRSTRTNLVLTVFR